MEAVARSCQGSPEDDFLLDTMSSLVQRSGKQNDSRHRLHYIISITYSCSSLASALFIIITSTIYYTLGRCHQRCHGNAVGDQSSRTVPSTRAVTYRSHVDGARSACVFSFRVATGTIMRTFQSPNKKLTLCLNFGCNREFGEYDLKVCFTCHQYIHGREFSSLLPVKRT